VSTAVVKKGGDEKVVELKSPAVVAAEAASASTEEKSPVETLSTYLCPECRRPRVVNHTEECSIRGTPWGKLSKDGKEERDLYFEDPKKATTKVPKPEASAKKSAKAEGKKVDELEKKDPLQTKDEFKLSPAQESGLRVFFGLKELPSAQVLKDLTREEARDMRRMASIPAWAIAAVRHHQDNYNAILAGKLTKESFQAGKFQRAEAPKSISGPEVTKKWLAIKDQFKGVTLLETPRSKGEKAFRKAFDKLKSEVGDRAELPKLRQGTGQSSRPDKQPRQDGSSGSGLGGLKDTLLLFAEIAKIMKG